MKAKQEFLKNLIKKMVVAAICALLFFACAFNFLGCKTKRQTVQTGVKINSAQPQAYNNSTNDFATEVIYNILEQYFKKTVMQNLPQTTLTRLNQQAKNVQLITAECRLLEEQYLSCFSYLNKNTQAITDALSRIQSNQIQSNDVEVLKNAYTNTVSQIGSNVLGKVAYSLCLYFYDYNYQTQMERYNNYGYSYLLEEAQNLLSEKNTLQQEVGEQNFVAVTQMASLFFDLFFGDAFQSEQLKNFTDNEILTLMQNPSFASVSISNKGWQLMLSYLNAFTSPQSYVGELFSTALNNGDLALFSSQMQNFLSLICNIQKKLTIEQVSLLRQNNTKQLITSIFNQFNVEEWDLFEQITSVSITKEEYDAVAKNRYGEEFDNYLSSLKTASFKKLKNAVNSVNFFTVLQEYIAGLSPAFSYGFYL